MRVSMLRIVMLSGSIVLFLGCIFSSQQDNSRIPVAHVAPGTRLAGNWVSIHDPKINRVYNGVDLIPAKMDIKDSTFELLEIYYFLNCGNCAFHPDASITGYYKFRTGNILISQDSLIFSKVRSNQLYSVVDKAELSPGSGWKRGYKLSILGDTLYLSPQIEENGVTISDDDTVFVKQ
jgi:hypothetical protein